MTRSQRIALYAGLALLVGMWIFPPWVHYARREADWREVSQPTGYFFIFDSDQGESTYNRRMIIYRIDFGRLFVQSVIVSAITAFAFAALRPSKPK